MLPMIKLGGLVARTLTKPLARVIKSRSKAHPVLNSVCYRLGQQQHRMTMKLHMGFRDISTYTIKPLPADQAVEQGADLVGEILIFSVALGVASLEYSRSAASARAKEAKQKEQQLQDEQEIEARFESLESQVAWLEHRLEAAMMYRLETNEMGTRRDRCGEQPNELTERQSEAGTLKRASRRQDENVHVDLESEEKTAMENSSSIADLWKSTYNAVAGLFK